MSGKKFFVCKHCGNLVGMLNDAGVPMVCCGEKMTLLEANTVDASQEKHVPVVTVEGSVVVAKVGSVEHPMVEEHFIQWIYLETSKGGHIRRFKPSESPEARFALAEGETAVAVYEYCNLHGLWKTTI